MPNTPNMNLAQPVIGVDSGNTWENAVNNNASLVDAHDHSPGKGLPVNPSGININGTLPLNNNTLSTVQAVIFTPQGTVTSTGTIYMSGADLYYNDASGNTIQITSGGTVNATSSGIVSGTATASFVGGVLVVNAAANTPANIQLGSALLGNNVANSKFLTLSPPPAMAANITETLPTIPVATAFMTMDNAGNMATSIPTSNGITGSMIAPNTIGPAPLQSGCVNWHTQLFTSSGTFNVPAGITEILIRGCGGGGGGGSGTSSSSGTGSGGGGGGEAAMVSQLFSSVTPLAPINVVIGTGGTGGAAVTNSSGNNGAAGGNTVIGAIATFVGGAGGTGGIGTLGGPGGFSFGGIGSGGPGGTNSILGGPTSPNSIFNPGGNPVYNRYGFNGASAPGASGAGGAGGAPSTFTSGGGFGGGGGGASTFEGGAMGGNGGAGGNGVPGANGANGQGFGAGAGGGGGSFAASIVSGAGGNGADGALVIAWIAP